MHFLSHTRAAAIAAAVALSFGAAGLASAQNQNTGPAAAARGTAMQVPLSKVSNPKGRLMNADVQDKNGTSVGPVRDVMVDGKGMPTALRVDVGGFLGVGSKLVEISAANFVYEQNREVLTVNLRKPQIEALQEVKA